MRSFIFRTITIVATVVFYIVSFVLLLLLDFEAQNGTMVSLINGQTAIFGGNSTIIRGTYSLNELVLDTSLFRPATFAFDYLTTIGLVVNVLTLIFMIFYFNRKILLLISTIVNVLSLAFLALQPQFFLVVNSGQEFYQEIYNPANDNKIISIGIIVFIIINGVIDLFYLVRSFALFKTKKTIE